MSSAPSNSAPAGSAPDRGAVLATLTERLSRLVTDPDAVRAKSSLWARLSARWLAPDAPLRTDAVRALADADIPTIERWDELLAPLWDELEANTARAERMTLRGSPPPAEELAWLLDLVAWLARIERVRDRAPRFAQHTSGLAHRRLVAACRPRAPDLALLDAILDEAAVETSRLGRRRRLLEAARRALLDVEDELSDDGTETAHAHALSACITRELVETSRLESHGVRLDRDLDVELRTRLARGDRGAATVAQALAWLDAPRARLEAIDALAHRADTAPTALDRTLGDAFERARHHVDRALEKATPTEALALRRHRRDLEEDSLSRLLRTTRLADALLETGGGLSQARFLADDHDAELTRAPAERMKLVSAEGVEDLASAVLDDPRRLVHELASGSLLTRRFVRPTRTDRRGRGPSAEVRLFLLDGSSSMRGVRARMRDAVILAELAALSERLAGGGRARQLLYYRYFHDTSEPLRRVRTIAEASEAMCDVIATPRAGGTDLEGAIADALRELEWAESNDVALTRAQIVLVSDGEAELDAESLHALAESLGVPLRLSIVGLGADGPALRALAAAQRRRGARVFHHRVSDAELEAWDRHMAARAHPAPCGLEATSALPLPTLALVAEDPRALEEAHAELALEAEALEARTRARSEAFARDVRALEARFDRFFPRLAQGPTTTGLHDDELLSFCLDALAALDSLEDPSASRVDRMADAIAVFVRMLAGRGLTPSDWDVLCARHPARLRDAIERVRGRRA